MKLPHSIETKTLGDLKVVQEISSLRNAVYLVSDAGGNMYIHKQYNAEMADPDDLEQELKFYDLGIGIKYRSPQETAKVSKELNVLGVNCPNILEHDANYTIEDYIKGYLVAEIQEPSVFQAVVKEVLSKIYLAHQQYMILGNRWFKRQLVTDDKTVYFMDLDVCYQGENLAELEMAEILNAITINRLFEDVVFVAKTFAELEKVNSYYKIPLIVEILEKHIAYWSDPQNILGSLIEVINQKKNGP